MTQINRLFTIYEEAIESMVRNGYLIHFSDNGEVVSKVSQLYENRYEIDSITSILHTSFNKLESTSVKLPPVNYGTAKNSVKNYTIEDKKDEILKSSYTAGYTFIYKSKEYNTAKMNSYIEILRRKDKELVDLKDECDSLKKQVSSLENKQRNILWVSFFAAASIILGVIVWTQVLFPNEVTKKDMGEYVYYGPMKNGEPNGTGVAIYQAEDKDGRLYYYGNFENGKRIDENAIMFYKDGSYFKGSMNEDKWEKGLLFDVEMEHFIGEFKDNKPWNGDWYKHVKEQTIENGG